MNGSEKTPFDKALESVDIKANVIMIMYRDGETALAHHRTREVCSILDIVELFTGRKIVLMFSNLECTAGSLVENPYTTMEKTLRTYEAPPPFPRGDE